MFSYGYILYSLCFEGQVYSLAYVILTCSVLFTYQFPLILRILKTTEDGPTWKNSTKPTLANQPRPE